jgi:hypothetical protein
MPEITGESMCPDMVGDEELPGVAAVADRCSRAEAGTTAVKPPNNGCPDTEMEDAESYAEQQRLERRFTWQWKKQDHSRLTNGDRLARSLMESQARSRGGPYRSLRPHSQ